MMMILDDHCGEDKNHELYGKDIDRGFIYRMIPDRPPIVLFKIDKGVIRTLTPKEMTEARSLGYNISRGQYFRTLDSKYIVEYFPVRHLNPRAILSISWGGEVKSLTKEDRISLNYEESLQHIYKSSTERYTPKESHESSDESSNLDEEESSSGEEESFEDEEEEESLSEEEESSSEKEESSSGEEESSSEKEESSSGEEELFEDEAEALEDEDESPKEAPLKKDDLEQWAYVFHQRVNKKLWVDMNDYIFEQIAKGLSSSEVLEPKESSFYGGELCPIADVPKEECMFCCHPDPSSPQKSASSFEEDEGEDDEEEGEEESDVHVDGIVASHSSEYEESSTSSESEESSNSFESEESSTSSESEEEYILSEDDLLKQAYVHMELFEFFLDRQILQSARVGHNIYCLKRFQQELEGLTRKSPNEEKRLKCFIAQRELDIRMANLNTTKDECYDEEKRLRHEMNSLRMMISEVEDLFTDDGKDEEEDSTDSSTLSSPPSPPTPSSTSGDEDEDDDGEISIINGLPVHPICCGMVKGSNGWVIDTSESRPTVLGKFVPENDCLQPLTQAEVIEAKALSFLYNY